MLSHLSAQQAAAVSREKSRPTPLLDSYEMNQGRKSYL